jgi:hypothetical protein
MYSAALKRDAYDYDSSKPYFNPYLNEEFLWNPFKVAKKIEEE